ncbi:MAG: hypothetical protein ABI615_07015 [Chthoniobacterales bacterium]
MAIIVGYFLLLLMAFLFVSAVLFGRGIMSKFSGTKQLIAWDIVSVVFLFFWLIGLVTELQRSEWIDLQRLMSLPVSLGGVFTINYLVSHCTFSIALVAPVVCGLLAGVVIAGNFKMALLAMPILGCLVFLTAWTYCLRGWLIALMINPRRRRTIIVCISMGFILLAQLPNLYFQTQHHGRISTGANHSSVSNTPKILSSMMKAHTYLPPLWIGRSALSLKEGNPLPALFYGVTAALLGGLGLWIAYRSTLRIYRGGTKGSFAKATQPLKVQPKGEGSVFCEREIPCISPGASGVAMASIRSMMRAPEIKMGLFSGLFMIVVLGVILFPQKHMLLGWVNGPFIVTVLISMYFFGQAQLFMNQFGCDRDGFRAYVLAPIARKDILIGKNLALAAFILTMGFVFLVLAAWLLHFSVETFLAGIFQLLSAFLIFTLIGNLFSILAPFRMAAGSLKPTKGSSWTVLLMLLGGIMASLALIVIYVPAFLQLLSRGFHFIEGFPVNLAASALLTISLGVVYACCVESQGRLLVAHERRILEIMAREVE